MGKNLIVDITVPNTKNFILENKNTPTKPLIVQGVIQRADAKNQNGRIYPFDILSREVEKYKETKIKENRAIGELDHPDSSIVSLKNGSHIILDVWWKGKDLYGKIKILSDIYDENGNIKVRGTTNGNILRAYFDHDVTVGISSRGLGSVENTPEGAIVKEDFELICWDFVSEPSTKGAFLNPINESLNREISYLKEEDRNFHRINHILDILLSEANTYCDYNKCSIIV